MDKIGIRFAFFPFGCTVSISKNNNQANEHISFRSAVYIINYQHYNVID